MSETIALSTPYDLFGPEFMDTVQGAVDDAGRPVDGMDLVCRTPLAPRHEILEQFGKIDPADPSAVRSFLDTYFEPRLNLSSRYIPAPRNLRDHALHMLTDVLVCKDTNPAEQYPKTQYLPLKHEFIVPDVERFPGIMFGWDDLEVVDGLLYLGRLLDHDEQKDVLLEQRIVGLVESIIQNKADLIDMLGYVPNGTIVSLATRAQLPVFPEMLDIYARYRAERMGGMEVADENHPLIKYRPQMQREMEWWGRGKQYLNKHPIAVTSEHVVRLRHPKDNSIAGDMYINYDPRFTPRDESYREDVHMAQLALKRDPDADIPALFNNFRRTGEHGWDFCWSRQNKIPELPFTNVSGQRIPVDLNAIMARNMELLAQACLLETQIPETSQERRQELGHLAQQYKQDKLELDKLINTFCWNPDLNLYDDWDFVEQRHVGAETLATMFPLFSGSAPKDRENMVVEREPDFRIRGGWATSLDDLDSQWSGKRMWPVLLRYTQKALERSGQDDIAFRGRGRAVAAYLKVFAETGKVPEKINGATLQQEQAGEYELHGDLAMSLGGVAAMFAEVLLERRAVQEKTKNTPQDRVRIRLLSASLVDYRA